MFGWWDAAGFLVGAVGVGLAIYQLVKASSARRVVRDWGADCHRRIGDAADALRKLDEEASAIDKVAWAQEKSRVIASIQERRKELDSIMRSTRAFLDNTVGGLSTAPATTKDEQRESGRA